jgi:hypothetical protein
MPFTPFHFGPAVLFKGVFPAEISATAFIATQVAVDSEVMWNLMRGNYPVHGHIHSLIAATAVGLSIGAVVHGFGIWFSPLLGTVSRSGIRAEWNWMGTLLGGAFGGTTHSLLDSLMYREIEPFWPLASINPLFGHVRTNLILLLCVVAGLAGAIWCGWKCRSTQS